MRYFLTLALPLFLNPLFGQEASVSKITTFPVNATLITPLEGSTNRGIVRIDKIEPNPYQLEAGDTLLAKFYFTLKPVKGEASLVGIKAGEEFSARMAARPNPLDGSYFFQIYHYKNISRIKAQRRQEALSSDESQK